MLRTKAHKRRTQREKSWRFERTLTRHRRCPTQGHPHPCVFISCTSSLKLCNEVKRESGNLVKHILGMRSLSKPNANHSSPATELAKVVIDLVLRALNSIPGLLDHDVTHVCHLAQAEGGHPGGPVDLAQHGRLVADLPGAKSSPGVAGPPIKGDTHQGNVELQGQGTWVCISLWVWVELLGLQGIFDDSGNCVLLVHNTLDGVPT
jgi:hypothetical protein